MQFPVTLQNSDTCILYEMPAGKIDPHGSCGLCPPPPGSERVRVLQTPLKNNTCTYYTMNFLRERVGKNPCEAHKKEREIEARVSGLRKAVSAHERSLPAMAHQLHSPIIKKSLVEIDVHLYLKNESRYRPILDTPERLAGAPSLFLSMHEFVREPRGATNLWEFLILRKFEERISIYQQFLGNDEVSLEKKGEGHSRKKDISELSSKLISQTADLQSKVYEKIAALLQLEFSSWVPNLGVTGLIHTLKKEGPLCVYGAFGAVVLYIDPPFEMRQKIQGRKIYAWHPQAKRIAKTFAGHAVLLVGARQEGDKAYVYFIDARDPSDPHAQEATQRIYMISYRNFQENLFSLRGEIRLDSSYPYAYRGRFLKA